MIGKSIGALCVFLTLCGSAAAITLQEYYSWIRASHIRYLYVSTDGGASYEPAEWLMYDAYADPDTGTIVYRLRTTDHQTAGQYAGRLGLYLREYIQPGGLPSPGYTHIYDYSSNAEARFSNGGVSYTYPAAYRNYIWGGSATNPTPLTTGTENGWPYRDWFIEMPYLGQGSRNVAVETCFIYQSQDFCQYAVLPIRGI